MLFFLLGRKGEGGAASIRRNAVLLTFLALSGLAPRETDALKCYGTGQLSGKTFITEEDCPAGVGCLNLLGFEPQLGVIAAVPRCAYGDDAFLKCMQTEFPGGTGPCTGKFKSSKFSAARQKCYQTTRSGDELAASNTDSEQMYCQCDTDLCNDDNFGMKESGAKKNTIRCLVSISLSETKKASHLALCGGTSTCGSEVQSIQDSEFPFEWATHICGYGLLDCMKGKYPGGSEKCTGSFDLAHKKKFEDALKECEAAGGNARSLATKVSQDANEGRTDVEQGWYNSKLCECGDKEGCNDQFGKDPDNDEFQKVMGALTQKKNAEKEKKEKEEREKREKEEKQNSGARVVVIGWGILAGALVSWMA